MEASFLAKLGVASLLLGCGLAGVNGFGSVDDARGAAAQARSVAPGAAIAANAGQVPPPPSRVPDTVVALPASTVPNAGFARSAEWVFGGKTQKGWYLYAPLVQNLVGSEAPYDSPEFAGAVAKWQKQNHMSRTDGVISADCWVCMYQTFQRARLGDATPPPADQLVEVPAEKWLDPSRPAELRQVRADAYDAYQRMVAAARAELGPKAAGDYFQIISGYRSRAYQEQLRQREGGNPSTASLAKNSPHFSGRALDIFVGGDPVSTKDENRAIQVATPAYQWLVKNAACYGFRPYFYEPWHWEFDPRLAAR